MEQGQVEALRDRSGQGEEVALGCLLLPRTLPEPGRRLQQEGDVERPRGAARGEGRLQAAWQGWRGAYIAFTKPEPQLLTALPQQVGRTRAGAGAQGAVGASRTRGGGGW